MQKRKKEEKKQSEIVDNRARVWTFIAYPESAPENWTWRLKAQHVPIAISPLHDKDWKEDDYGMPMPDTGELKKPHWHVILYFDGKKSYEQVKEIADLVNAAPPARVGSVRGMTRYLCHLDDPEKHLYDVSGVVCLSGADVAEYMAFSGSELTSAIWEMEQYIIQYNVTEFSDLVDYARVYEKAWHYVLHSKKTQYFKAYIQSCRHRREGRNGKRQVQVDDNGEVV